MARSHSVDNSGLCEERDGDEDDGRKLALDSNALSTSQLTSAHGGGAFFIACQDFGRMFDNSFPALALFVVFVFKWRLARTH